MGEGVQGLGQRVGEGLVLSLASGGGVLALRVVSNGQLILDRVIKPTQKSPPE